MIGLAIRLALALGLHLRNEDLRVGESNKESRVHTWWTLNSIECLMSTTTGRPPAVAFEDCTVPLPHSLPGERERALRRRTERGSISSTKSGYASKESEQTPVPGQHHLDHINITVITQKVLIDLYSPRTATKSWEVCLKLHLVRSEAFFFGSNIEAKVVYYFLRFSCILMMPIDSSSKAKFPNTSNGLKLGQARH
jgi:hypothetical protein